MRKLSKEKENLMNDAFVKYPLASDNDIAKMTGVSQPTVSKHRKDYTLAIDTAFIAMVAGKFIQEFGKAAQHWSAMIQELEELKEEKKTIVKQNTETKGYYTESVPLDPMEKVQIIKEQANLRARILFLAGQGEVREVIKVMRNGNIPTVSQ